MWAASASTATRAVLVLDTAEDERGIGAAKAEAVGHHGVERLFAAFAQDGQVVLIYGVRLAVKGFDVGLHQCGGGDKQAEAFEAVLQKRALLVGNVSVFIGSEVGHGGDGEAVGDGGAVVEGVGLENGVHFVSFLMERVDAFFDGTRGITVCRYWKKYLLRFSQMN